MSDQDLSRKTKAELLQQIGALTERLAAKETADRQSAPRRGEAGALKVCIDAIDFHLTSDERKATYSSLGPVDRILRFLAAKYSVPLIETQVRDCNRKHVDEIQPHQLTTILQGLQS